MKGHFKKSQNQWPGAREGVLHLFGLIDNPYAKKIAAIYRGDELTYSKVLSDAEAMAHDAEAIRSDWEKVGDDLRYAIVKLKEEHPELIDQG